MRSVLLAALLAAPAVAADLTAGAAATVITPPLGTSMAGYYYSRAADGIHDDLYAKALVLGVGDARVALVALDLISTNRPMVMAARREVERLTGIPGGHVMISATHAHTGPVLSTTSLRDAFDAGTDLARRYSEELPAKIADAVKRADAARQPVQAKVGRGHEEGIAFNRRYHMADGTVGWNPGVGNPRIVKPAGGIDPDVHVLTFGPPGKKPAICYVNHAVHLDTVGGTKFSADLPGVLAKLLEESIAPGLQTVYTTGCCGDVNHVNVAWDDKSQKGFEQASRMAVILGAEVLRTLPKLQPVAATGLRVRSELVKLPLPPVTVEDVAKAKDVIARRGDGKSGQVPFLEQVAAFKALDVAERKGEPHEVEVQVIALGSDVAWVSLPGEMFAELGRAVKQDSPFAHTVVAELANGSVGYVPARRAYAQGNYEVVSTRVAMGGGEMLIDAAVRLLKELHTK
ncbi:MAG: hypothetical protein U0746_10700 [Gemmataceae bacterium]